LQLIPETLAESKRSEEASLDACTWRVSTVLLGVLLAHRFFGDKAKYNYQRRHLALFSRKMQKAETQEGMNLDQEMTVKLLGKGDKKQL